MTVNNLNFYWVHLQETTRLMLITPNDRKQLFSYPLQMKRDAYLDSSQWLKMIPQYIMTINYKEKVGSEIQVNDSEWS